MITSTITAAASSQAPFRCPLPESKATVMRRQMPINVYMAGSVALPRFVTA